MLVKIFDYGDVERVTRKLYASAQAAKPVEVKPAFNRIESDMRRAVKQVFKSQGRRGGGSWKRLEADTVRKKGMSKILFTMGAADNYSDLGNDALFRSVTVRSDPDHIYEVMGYLMEFGTHNPHAKIMEDGAPGKNIQARPFIRFTPYDIDRWKGILNKQLMKVWLRKK